MTRRLPTLVSHMRGEDELWGYHVRPGVRFTPTCVGKTGPPHSFFPLPAVHPHMRGEDVVELMDMDATMRFTPTCVGKTTDVYPAIPARSVHPHMRGEDVSFAFCRMARAGSPPHAWGRRKPCTFGRYLVRFTPTCVGKTSPSTKT